MSVTNQQRANAIRFLSMDAVQKANSGHPGAPMGMADIAEVLWTQFLKHNPKNPQFANRDRFVLSNGHASMMLYSLLHLSGYDLPIEELKNFRQLGSKTPGHPEYRDTVGVETTTGPLGQGIANAVGMALAEKMMAAQFNKADLPIVDHYTYVMLGDGCLMEGISHEACAIAGTWGLGKLIALYDDNGISIDGEVEGWFTDDTAARFESYGWQVIRNVKGHDPVEIATAIETAKAKTNRPTLIMCKTTIGFGAPNKEGTESVHGAPLGADEIAAARAHLNWEHEAFVIPQAIYDAFSAVQTGADYESQWNELFAKYQAQFPELAAEFKRRSANKLPADFAKIVEQAVQEAQAAGESIATRVASQKALNALGVHLPELVGGSADLTPSNNTFFKASVDYDIASGAGNYLRYGVREFGMSAIMNGLALHGGLKPYGATFLVFSDYCRNAIRMSAIMKIPTIYVMTHDSIGLGEDGPTHQPIEHVASLRLIPNLEVWRPADSTETMVAWACAIQNEYHPSLFALSRQNLTCQPRNATQMADIQKGGYVLLDAANAKLTLIATGSEVELAMKVANQMGNVRVVSMPCVERFKAQSEAYQTSVLGAAPKLAIEAGASAGWYEFADHVVGIDRFGASAPAAKLFEKYGLTVDAITAKAKSLMA